MSVKVTIFNKQKKIKLPVGTKLLIRKACTATLKLEGFENPAEVAVYAPSKIPASATTSSTRSASVNDVKPL